MNDPKGNPHCGDFRVPCLGNQHTFWWFPFMASLPKILARHGTGSLNKDLRIKRENGNRGKAYGNLRQIHILCTLAAISLMSSKFGNHWKFGSCMLGKFLVFDVLCKATACILTQFLNFAVFEVLVVGAICLFLDFLDLNVAR